MSQWRATLPSMKTLELWRWRIRGLTGKVHVTRYRMTEAEAIARDPCAVPEPGTREVGLRARSPIAREGHAERPAGPRLVATAGAVHPSDPACVIVSVTRATRASASRGRPYACLRSNSSTRNCAAAIPWVSAPTSTLTKPDRGRRTVPPRGW